MKEAYQLGYKTGKRYDSLQHLYEISGKKSPFPPAHLIPRTQTSAYHTSKNVPYTSQLLTPSSKQDLLPQQYYNKKNIKPFQQKNIINWPQLIQKFPMNSLDKKNQMYKPQFTIPKVEDRNHRTPILPPNVPMEIIKKSFIQQKI